MKNQGVFQCYSRFLALAAVMFVLAGCQMAPKPAEFKPLPNGILSDTGVVIEEPGVFKITGGEPFVTPFSIDCTQLSDASDGYAAALAAGAHRVVITLPNDPNVYGGVVAFCRLYKASATSYDLSIPPTKLIEALRGAVATVVQQVPVNRVGTGPNAKPVTQDFAWMLWLSFPPATLGVTAEPSIPPVELAKIAPPKVRHAPPLVKGKTYTVTAKTLALRAEPAGDAAIVSKLSRGDALVATGEQKKGFWAVTTVGGESGWVQPLSLKGN